MRISVQLMQRFAAESPIAAFKLNMAVLEILGRRLRESNSRYTESLAIISALSEDGTVMNPDAEPSEEKVVAYRSRLAASVNAAARPRQPHCPPDLSSNYG